MGSGKDRIPFLPLKGKPSTTTNDSINNSAIDLSNKELISSVKFDTNLKKREKKEVTFDAELVKEISSKTTSSASTIYSISEICKRREYKGFKIFKRQNGGKDNITTYKHSLKSQSTGRWRYFRLYNE